MLNCQQVTRLLSEAQERKLSMRERAALKMHRMICSGCNNFGKQILTMSIIAKKYISDKKVDDYLNDNDTDKNGNP